MGFKLQLAMGMKEEMTDIDPPPLPTQANPFYKLPPERFAQLQLRQPAHPQALVGERERPSGGMESSVLWGGSTASDPVRCGINISNHYTSKNMEE